MTQEDRELLFKDISARLPYAVKVKIGNNLYIVDGIDIGLNDEGEWVPRVCTHGMTAVEIEYCKPYLFPMSSMTEEQEEELKKIYYSFTGMFHYTERIFDRIPFSKMKYFPYQIEEFFNKNHIDYRGLIPMGLANDATDKNIY